MNNTDYVIGPVRHPDPYRVFKRLGAGTGGSAIVGPFSRCTQFAWPRFMRKCDRRPRPKPVEREEVDI